MEAQWAAAFLRGGRHLPEEGHVCRIIFEAEGVVRRAQLDHDVSDELVDQAVNLVHQMSMWRFVAVERCVWWDAERQGGDEARLEAL